jgi:hypothetical protein
MRGVTLRESSDGRSEGSLSDTISKDVNICGVYPTKSMQDLISLDSLIKNQQPGAAVALAETADRMMIEK